MRVWRSARNKQQASDRASEVSDNGGERVRRLVASLTKRGRCTDAQAARAAAAARLGLLGSLATSGRQTQAPQRASEGGRAFGRCWLSIRGGRERSGAEGGRDKRCVGEGVRG